MSRPIADPYPDTTPTQLLNRTYLVGNTNWTPGFAGLDLFFPAALTSNPTIANVLKRYRFFRADVQVEIKVNSTPYHQGALVSAFLPCHNALPSINPSQIPNFLTGVPNSVIISSSTQDSVKMDLPWLSPTDWYDSYSDGLASSEIGLLSIKEFNALVATSAGQSASVPLLVFASFKNIRTTGFVSDSAKENKEAQVKAKDGLDAKGIVSTVSKVLRQVPVVGGAYGKVADLINNFAGDLSKPISMEAPHPMIYSHSNNLNLGHGLTSAIPLSLYPNPQLTQSPVFETMETSHCSVASLAQRPMIYARTTLSTTNSTIGIPVLLNTNYLSTPSYTVNQLGDWLATTSKAFRYWRGSIKYLIHVNVPAFYSFRMRLTLRYKNTYVDLGDLQSQVIDIKGETWVPISIPFLYKRMYFALETEAINTGHPWLSITLETPIVGSSSLATPFAYINIFRAGGEDIQFAQPQGVKTYTRLPSPTPRANKEFTSDSAPEQKFKTSFPTLIPGVTQAIERNFCQTETVQTVSDLLKRPSYWKPNNSLTFFNFQMGAGNAEFIRQAGEPFWYFMSLFLFWRGSHNVHFPAGVGNTYMLSLESSGKKLGNAIAPTYGDAGYLLPINMTTVGQMRCVNVPYFCTQPWYPVGQPGPVLSSTVTQFPSGYFNNPSKLYALDITTLNGYSDVAISAGDDFIAMYPMPYFPWYFATLDFTNGFVPNPT